MSTTTTYLKPPEAAAYIKLSASTLAKMRLYGGGPAYLKMGRSVRYEVEELDRWAAQRRISSTSQSPAVAS